MTNPYRIPHYPNNADYTTNAASYYDDLARKNALMKHLAQRIWEYDKELAKRFLQWEENLATINEDVKKMLQDWMDDGTLADIINEEIFAELNQEIQDLLAAFEAHKLELAAAEQAKKEVDLNKANAHYVGDLHLEHTTINQGIAFDEENGHIYGSQVFNYPGDIVESFYINRMTLGGKRLDGMMIRQGGHGTSFGVEVENGQVFIWSNMIKPKADGTADIQYLARFPYVPGTEITSDSPNVVKYKEYPDVNLYQSPVIDNKRGLIALRVTDSRSGNNKTHMELYTLENIKNRSYVEEGRFHFTNGMNVSTLQGIAIDGQEVYLSFGYSIGEYLLVHADMNTDTILGQYNANQLEFQQAPDAFEVNFSEPEGLYVYTDPKTNHKTLFQVIVTSAATRRRNRLYAISSNDGYVKFIGNTLEYAQLHALTLSNGRAKPVEPNFSELTYLKMPGDYYMTTAESNQFSDFPLPNIAGWWITVSGGDTGGGVLQTFRRNSSIHSTTLKRIVFADGTTTAWEGVAIRPDFENGYTDFYQGESSQKFMYSKMDNTLHLKGIIQAPPVLNTEDNIFTLPSGFRPAIRQCVPVVTSNGIMECMVYVNGEVKLSKYLTDTVNPSFVHLNATIALNGTEIS